MTFVSRIDGSAWPDRIRRFRHFVSKTPYAAGTNQDLEMFLRDVRSQHPVVVITDSPQIDETYLRALAAEVPLVISIDEAARFAFSNGLVLNPTLGRTHVEYNLNGQTQVLAGERYAMIRAEFRRARHVRATEPGGVPRLLLALGGGETAGHTAMLAAALLKEIKNVEKIDAVVGASRSVDALEALAAQFPDRLTIARDVRDLGIRMTKAHLLITGGGNTALEAACVGVPMILVSRQLEQQLTAVRLEELGVAHYLGPIEKVKPAQLCRAAESILSDRFERRVMSRAGRMLIDGRGPDRLVTATEILLRRTRRAHALAA
jgi:spore coat polysaccharide biosynthesis predicted glycosyltransferase SpsG